MTTQAIQEEIIDEFSLLEGDQESKIFYIMELGEKLPPMDNALKTEDHIIKGCQSKVWLVTSLEEGKVYFQADSNTGITKGLISLLVRIFSGKSPNDILNANLFFLEKIGMDRLIGSQRSNGLASMIKQIKMYALAYQSMQA
jgi:cysteine desulfuration protein SufE